MSEVSALERQLSHLTLPRQRGYRRLIESRLEAAVKYPNVTRAEWSAMCRRSWALQAEASECRRQGREAEAKAIYDSLGPLHEHMRAISNLQPTDGPPPRDR
jgi:hypothetical protein